MLIDFHTHCFPDKLAERAISKLSFESGNMQPHYDGSFSGLKNSMAQSGVDVSVVLHIATNAHQMHSVNDFAAYVNNGKDIFSFGSVHPEAPDALEELERIKALGLKGVKFHPEYQEFEVDDEKMKPIYKKVSQLGLIAVFHAGQDYGFPPPYRAMPRAMARAASWFDSPVVAAHWGGVGAYDESVKYLCGENLYFDVSFGYGVMPKAYASTIVEKHGAGKLLFGTDGPWHSAAQELRLLSSLGLTGEESAKITHLNACSLLGIEQML